MYHSCLILPHRFLVHINLHNFSVIHGIDRLNSWKHSNFMFMAHHGMEEMRLSCPYFVRYWYQRVPKFSGNLDICPYRPVLITHTECNVQCRGVRNHINTSWNNLIKAVINYNNSSSRLSYRITTYGGTHY